MNRFELALHFERLLGASGFLPPPDKQESLYRDLSKDQQKQISRVIALNVMSGFPDRSFRPSQELRNIEFIQYLRRLDQCLRSIGSINPFTERLVRIFSYADPPPGLLIPALIPRDFSAATSFLLKQPTEEYLARLSASQAVRKTRISGTVYDSVSLKPVSEAFVASCGKATATNEKGQFVLEVESDDIENSSILCAAPGYSSLEIRRNLGLSTHMEFRLNRDRSNL